MMARPARPDCIGTGGSGLGNIGILGIKSEEIILNYQKIPFKPSAAC